MPAKASKPRSANKKPWTIPMAKNAPVPVGSGITQSELDQREERRQYLKRRGETFV